jgi:hypothetical protein
MNTMRWKLWERLKGVGIPVIQRYGYQTKHDRIRLGLSKSHSTDAYLIAGGKGQDRATQMYDLRQIRKQNRKLYRGKRSEVRNQVGRLLHGYRQWDKVGYRGENHFVKGRRSSGYFSLSDIHGKVSEMSGKKLAGVKHIYLSLVEMSTTLLTARRKRLSSPLTQRGIQPQA